MKLYASISSKEWKDEFLTNGIKAGDIEGTANDEAAILVQKEMFAFDANVKSKIVEFEESLDKVYVDWDDDVEAYELFESGMFTKTYAGIDEEALKDYTMYGSYVKEIKPEQIIKVYDSVFVYNDDDSYLLVDGKRI